MRKLRIFEHVSLDGVMQHTADENSFAYTDWSAPYRTPAGRDMVLAAYGDRYDLLLGRRTYDIWSKFWPTSTGHPMGDRINAATKYVVTHRPESLEWGPVEALGPDLTAAVQQLKEQDGPDLVVSGSSTLSTPLLEAGLADELVLAVYPLLLGVGKRFFAEGTFPSTLEFLNTQTTPTGVQLQAYKVKGPLQVGKA